MNKKNKSLLIASFISKTTLDWTINYLKDKFNIKKDNIYVYEISDNDSEYLLTFKINNNSRIDLKSNFVNATIVNIKNGCIFSINGLNKLIEYELDVEEGNANYKTHIIDWEKYKNKLVLCNKKVLIIKSIKKINSIIKKNEK